MKYCSLMKGSRISCAHINITTAARSGFPSIREEQTQIPLVCAVDSGKDRTMVLNIISRENIFTTYSQFHNCKQRDVRLPGQTGNSFIIYTDGYESSFRSAELHTDSLAGQMQFGSDAIVTKERDEDVGVRSGSVDISGDGHHLID